MLLQVFYQRYLRLESMRVHSTIIVSCMGEYKIEVNLVDYIYISISRKRN